MLCRIALLSLFCVTGLWADRVHLLLKSTGRLEEQALTARGLKLVEALGDGEWIVSAESGSAAARLAQALPLERKLSEDLRQSKIPLWAQVKMRGAEGAELLVYFHKDVSADEAQWEIDRMGGRVVDRSDYFERLTVEVRVEDLTRLAGMDWVRFVEPVFAPYKLMSNAESAALIKVKELQEQFALDGAGAKVAVVDDPVATHPEFGTRLKQLQTSAGLVHGTHVAGTVGASGSTDPRLKGMAPAARILSFGFSSVSAGVSANLNSKLQEQADLAQNSWGLAVAESLNNCSFFGAYTSLDREIDRIAYEQKYPLVFSAGNERDSPDCLIDARAGFYSMPPPASSKNVIAVGATDRGNALSEFSSFGPARDGRLKPDLVALGVDVLSTSIRNGSTTLSGTSMSAPAVSGLAALLIDRYRGKYGKAPAPELLRAFLLNTARDLGNPGPDYSYGYGIPDGVTAVKAIDDDNWNTGTLSSGETKEFELELPGGQPSFRVMLAWTDPAAPAGRVRQLMNDLDLRLVGPDGQRLQPFVFDPQRPELDATTGDNVLDNVEQIAVNQPGGGKWKIVVSAKELAIGPQDYAITWTTAENPAPPCSTTVYPTDLPVSENATTVTLRVARSSTCEPWTATGGADWLQPGDPSNNRATGTLKLRVAKNDSGQQRRASLTVAGRSVTIRQNTSCVAQPITSGVAVTASLTAADCLDETSRDPYFTKIYTFRAEAGQRVTITADSRILDSFLILYGPGNILIAADDDSGGNLNSRIPASGSLALPISGTYRIVMTTATSGETGSFTLTMTLGPATGNVSALPKVINSCPASVNGELSSNSSTEGRRGDLYNTDIYYFEGRLGQSLSMGLPQADFDGTLLLIGPNNAIVASADDTDGRLPRIDMMLAANGVYRLEVSSFAPFGTGKYTLQANGCAEWAGR